ncbi:MAG: NAD(P)/FAD-dependent oxidoreductase [Clostridia bacterium]|nr:NAD(P)/FAD-dependent oxidoreductase [Clostridia bacterium]
MSEHVFDLAIIGGGPAGVSAAINAKILNKSVIWFAADTVSKKVARAELIKNYPALPDITGEGLAQALKRHAESMGIEQTNEVITGVYPAKGKFLVLAGAKDFKAKTVILCLGVQTQKPINGEERLLGRGVSYCATCDGFLYRGRKIAIYCTDKRFEGEIEFLCSVAEKAYVMPMYKNYEIKAKNAEIILKQPEAFEGEDRFTAVRFKDGLVEADGVFVLKTAISPATLVHGLKTEDGHIAVNRRMETNIAGLFAAGDCTGRPYQYIKAAGEGNVAAHSAIEYLDKN